MCGIAGIYHFDPCRRVDARLIDRMTDLLSHRGPDDRGVHLEGNLALGHRRLSIIDLETGHQPMSDGGGQIWLVVNGEIYNYKSLRRRLKSYGHRFKTNSDSEVIIHAYEQWGLSFAEYLNGMFAAALWDGPRRRLVLARDRLGIKPLYFSLFDDSIVFASEPKSILTYPGFPTAVDKEAVLSYLSFRTVVGGGTLFEGIDKLPPGTILVADGDGIRTRKYWRLPINKEKRDRGEAYYLKKVRELVTKAVEKRLASDVPLGAYLSGGLDSSIVVAVMAGAMKEPVRTYTIGFDENGFNEMGYAIEVARMHKTNHKEIRIEETDYIEHMTRLIRYKDAPLSVANEVPLYLMSKELKKNITVVLSGEGADELFAGYGRIFRSPFDYERTLFLRRHPEIVDGPASEFLSKVEDIYGTSTFEGKTDHFLRKYRWFSAEDEKRLLNPEFVSTAAAPRRSHETFTSILEGSNGLNHYEKILYAFQTIHLENLLMRVDMTTMATAVEARVPFVDHELVEFVFNIPLHYKLRWKSEMHRLMSAFLTSDEISETMDITKYILREAFKDKLPGSITERRKMGFPVPLNRWFGGKFKSYLEEILLDDRTTRRGIVDTRSIERVLNSGGAPIEHADALKLWMLLNLELWHREYIDSYSGVASSRTFEGAAGADRTPAVV